MYKKQWPLVMVGGSIKRQGRVGLLLMVFVW